MNIFTLIVLLLASYDGQDSSRWYYTANTSNDIDSFKVRPKVLWTLIRPGSRCWWRDADCMPASTIILEGDGCHGQLSDYYWATSLAAVVAGVEPGQQRTG